MEWKHVRVGAVQTEKRFLQWRLSRTQDTQVEEGPAFVAGHIERREREGRKERGIDGRRGCRRNRKQAYAVMCVP